MLVLTLAFRYLVGRIRQSWLTIIGVALGIVALTVMQAMMLGLRGLFIERVLGTVPHIIVKKETTEKEDALAPSRVALSLLRGGTLAEASRRPAPDLREEIRGYREFERRIRETPGVAVTAPLVEGDAVFTFGGRAEPVHLMGVDPLRQAQVVAFADKLLGISPQDLAGDQYGVILGRHLADTLGARVGDRVTAIPRDGGTVSLRVLGLYESRVYDVDLTTAFVNLRRGQSLLGMDGTVTSIQARVVDRTEAAAIGRQIQGSTGLHAESWLEGHADRLRLINMITTIMLSVVALTMVISGMGIATTLITIVSEKAFDIGVLKAMGMRPRSVALIFLLLSLLLMGLGVLIGDGIAYGIIEVLRRTPTATSSRPGAGLVDSDTWPMEQSLQIYLVSAVFALVVSAIAGVSPALRAARLTPLAIIRNAGD